MDRFDLWYNLYGDYSFERSEFLHFFVKAEEAWNRLMVSNLTLEDQQGLFECMEMWINLYISYHEGGEYHPYGYRC